MTNAPSLDAFGSRLRDLIAPGFPADDASFKRLALELFALQFAHNEPLRAVCQHRGMTPQTVTQWDDLPAMPAVAFKEFDLTSLPPNERTTVFHSSGTTEHRPSRHYHNAASLAVYEASLRPWFQQYLVPESTRLPIMALMPRASEAPHSSLVHMCETVVRDCGMEDSRFVGGVDAGGWTLDGAAAVAVLRDFARQRQPVVLLGTAFSFVFLLDFLASRGERIELPAGSRVMETGGYKGRSRELPKAELHRLITHRLGVPPTHIVCEYGMSELSSQAYDGEVRSAECGAQNRPRVFRFPPWARALVVSPETGKLVREGETGLIRVIDLANVRSVLAVQTEDLGVRRGDGFELLGRAVLAEARGCSLMTL